MTTAQAIQDDAQSALDAVSIFLPPAALKILESAASLLARADIDVNAFIATVLGLGEEIIERGLELSTENAERLVEKIYEAGVITRLGKINSFLRDGAEIGIQLGLNTLKALEPADVAKLLAIALIAWMAPNILLVNGPELFSVLSTLVLKVWNLP
jgi:hypothetical protein